MDKPDSKESSRQHPFSQSLEPAEVTPQSSRNALQFMQGQNIKGSEGVINSLGTPELTGSGQTPNDLIQGPKYDLPTTTIGLEPPDKGFLPRDERSEPWRMEFERRRERFEPRPSRSESTISPSESRLSPETEAIIEAEQKRATVKPLSFDQFKQQAKKIFGRLDTNKDRYLDDGELGRAVEDPKINGLDAEALAVLNGLREQLKPLSNDQWFSSETKVHKNDIMTAVEASPPLKSLVVALDEAAEIRRYDRPSGLYADPLHPIKSISHRAVNQSTIGDCHFEASVASIAATSPEKIERILKDNGDDTFTVTFPGDPSNPIIVATPTETERALYNKSQDYGLWPNVLEKAYGKYRHQHGYGGNTTTEGADGGGHEADVLWLLTGKTADVEYLSDRSRETIRRKLTEAFKEHRAVICGIESLTTGTTANGYDKKHDYSITDWNDKEADGGWLCVRDPRGRDLSVSFNKFMNNFTRVTFEGR